MFPPQLTVPQTDTGDTLSEGDHTKESSWFPIVGRRSRFSSFLGTNGKESDRGEQIVILWSILL